MIIRVIRGLFDLISASLKKQPTCRAMLYVFDEIDELDDDFLGQFIPFLPEERREKVFYYRFPRDRKLSAVVYLLLRLALMEKYGINEPVVFAYGKNGKPFLRDYPNIHFNLSHCHSAAVCVIADTEVGVDVQEIAPVSDDLARRVLSVEEYSGYKASLRPDELFCKMWTAKESRLKRTGRGIGCDLTALPAEDNGTIFKGKDYYCSVNAPFNGKAPVHLRRVNIRDFNMIRGSVIVNTSFLERFEKYKASQKTALVCGDTSLSYTQLHTRCSVLAAKLRERGVGLVSTVPESYDIFDPESAEHSPWVVIIAERSVNAVIGIIAAWMAGGAYVLMGSDAPDSYMENIVEDTAAAVVLRDEDFASLDVGTGLTYNIPQKNEIACAIFTSGSTGKPRGAVLEHRTINEIIQWQTEYMKPDAAWTATAMYAPFSFIASLWEFFFPLVNGLALHILDENTRRDLFELENYIEANNISYTFLPPNIAEVFTQTYKGSSLKYLRVAGGRLKSCGDPAGRYEIMYHLGMSENGGSVTFKPIREAVNRGASNGGDISIGKPWNRTRVDILDSTGEMAVSGPSLFRGYLARREETKNKFADGRFLSGDIARFDDNGEIVHMGRNDWNVKIRDMKVNPLQVESVLGKCKGVTDCCVISQTLGGEDILIGWAEGNTTEEALRAELAERLPEYMIPSAFIVLEKMPRNLNGKIDRAADGSVPAFRSDAPNVAVVANRAGPRQIYRNDQVPLFRRN